MDTDTGNLMTHLYTIQYTTLPSYRGTPTGVQDQPEICFYWSAQLVGVTTLYLFNDV